MTKPCPNCGAAVPVSDTRCVACRFNFPPIASRKSSKKKWIIGGGIALLVVWAIVPRRAPDVPIQMVKRSEVTKGSDAPTAPIPSSSSAPTNESKMKLFADCLGLPPKAAPSAWRSVHGDVDKAITFLHIVYSGDLDGTPLSLKEKTCLKKSGLSE